MSRLFDWAMAANAAYLTAKRDVLVDSDGRPLGLRRDPGMDPLEALDAANECDHGYLPHYSFVGCSCWLAEGRESDLNKTERPARPARIVVAA